MAPPRNPHNYYVQTSPSADDGVELTSSAHNGEPVIARLGDLAAALGASGGGIVVPAALTRVGIQAAIDSLPAYSGGIGGGIVQLPPGTITLANGESLTKPSGVSLRGAGMHATKLAGNVAGPLIRTVGDGSGTAELYYAVEDRDLTIANASTNAAARALSLEQCSKYLASRVRAISAGGYNVYVKGGDDLTFDDCELSGGASDTALYLDGQTSAGYINLVRLIGTKLRDAKRGLVAVGGSALSLTAGCQIEQTIGGASGYLAAISIDGWLGGEITGCYFDSNAATNIQFYDSEDSPRGWVVGGNYAYNTGGPQFCYLGNLRDSHILPNVFVPGALNANPKGVVVASPGSGVRVERQFMKTGTGLAADVSGSNNTYVPTQDAALAAVQSAVAASAPLLDDHLLTGNTTTGQVGSSGLTFTGGAASVVASEAGHAGIARLAVTATNPTTGGFTSRSGTASGGLWLGGDFRIGYVARYGLNGGSKAQTVCRIGASDSMFSTGTPVEIAYLECLAADTNWFAVTGSGGSTTRVDTGVAFTDAGWLTVDIARVGGTITFIVNGGTPVTSSTNLPATAGQLGVVARTTEAVAKNIDLDRLTIYAA